MILENKVIKSIIPFIGTMVLVCGYVKLSIYYSHFDVEINNYLEFTEILTLFLPDIIKYGLIIFVIYLFNFIFESKSETIRNHDARQAISDSTRVKERIKNHYKFNKEFVWLTVLLIIVYPIVYIWFRDRFWDILFFTFYIPVILIFIVLLLEFRHKYKELYGEYFNPTYNNLILIFFLFSLYSIGSVQNDIKKVKTKHPIEISFEIGTKKIETDSTLIYIGQTRNYLFLRNLDKKESRILKRSEIKNIIMHGNR